MSKEQEANISVVPYRKELKEAWDLFVEQSRNGTFLLKRDYVEYHSDRFRDHSLLFYKGGRITALLPAHISNDRLCTHNGLTYGGFILSDEATADTVLALFRALRDHLRHNTQATSIVYRPIPHIYHRYPCEEDLYALFRCNATLTERKISTTTLLNAPLPFTGRRELTAAMKNRLHIVEDGSFAPFWQILSERLLEKYGATPVHTLDEIERLHNSFPRNIKLFTVTNEQGETLGGVVLYVTDNVVHLQYTASSERGRKIGVMDHLYKYLTLERFKEHRYFDYGTSVEDGGHTLNSGLIHQKERLGGRAIVYDTYLIELNNIADD